jgi:hypothetical protein
MSIDLDELDRMTRLRRELDACTPDDLAQIAADIELRLANVRRDCAVREVHAGVLRTGWHVSTVDLGELDQLVRLPETYALRALSSYEYEDDSMAVLFDVADELEQAAWVTELGYVYPKHEYLGSHVWDYYKGETDDDDDDDNDDNDDYRWKDCDSDCDVRTATVVRRVWIYCAPIPPTCPPLGTRLVVFHARTSSIGYWKVRTHGVYDADREHICNASEWPVHDKLVDWHILRIKRPRAVV